jgi:hypothetical protein
MIVPFTVAWSGETGHVVRHDPQLGGAPALFVRQGQRGEGRPLYSDLSEARQRQCVRERLCSVCGEAIPVGEPGVALLITADPGEAWSENNTLGDITEPLVCRACLAGPLQHCPRVREAATSGLLHPLAVTTYSWIMGWYTMAQFDNKPAVRGAMRAAGVSRCVGMLVIRPLEARWLTVAELFELAGLVAP